jgi:hypothetical protein
VSQTPETGLDPTAKGFYKRSLETLDAAGVRYMLGGAYALGVHTGIVRHTKDLDLFLLQADVDRALAALDAAGYATEKPFPHWLAKAWQDDLFVDLIYSSGNGVAVVDEGWFDHAAQSDVFGHRVLVIPPEEMIWSKAWVQERERYDGADIMHLLRAKGAQMDWPRLLRRFDERWRVLLAFVVNFGFVYPGDRSKIPAWVVHELTTRLEKEQMKPPAADDANLCRGTLLSREQYCVDIGTWGKEDARLRDDVAMSADDIKVWTDAIETPHIHGAAPCCLPPPEETDAA